ncbi:MULTISPECIES: metal ABC transporter substrate-binding protein [unclassified Actinomyces]|uniref:metal ABC transporter substrate-binding protein n=1 Tax=unclassified Actinomyces TaxID=2609248 RepID=UPI002018027F|nr:MULTISPECIES: metal ABC transporter substrate-binding protein [unclassified Actinomyces]
MHVPTSRLRRPLAVAAALALAGSLAACGGASSTSSDDGVLDVSVSFYPIQYLVEAIGGDAVNVTSVTPVNVEPHDFELAPADVAALEKADLVAYASGFQASLDEALAQVDGPTVLDIAGAVDLVHHEGVEHDHEGEGEAHDHEAEDADHDHEHADEADPHFWLDPERMVAAAGAIEAALEKADPANASTYQAGLAELVTTLNGIDEDYTSGLASCERTTFITSHAAFGYLADRYGLTQVSVSGVDPEAEPSPADLAAVKEVVHATGTTTVFTEELVSPETAQALADETGATTAVLSPMESQPEAGDYAAGMSANLEALRTALACK